LENSDHWAAFAQLSRCHLSLHVKLELGRCPRASYSPVSPVQLRRPEQREGAGDSLGSQTSQRSPAWDKEVATTLIFAGREKQ